MSQTRRVAVGRPADPDLYYFWEIELPSDSSNIDLIDTANLGPPHSVFRLAKSASAQPQIDAAAYQAAADPETSQDVPQFGDVAAGFSAQVELGPEDVVAATNLGIIARANAGDDGSSSCSAAASTEVFRAASQPSTRASPSSSTSGGSQDRDGSSMIMFQSISTSRYSAAAGASRATEGRNVEQEALEAAANLARCIICKDNTVTSKLRCGHCYCSICLQRLKAQKDPCPKCRQKFCIWEPMFLG